MNAVFFSRFHPSKAPDLRAFRTALTRPLAACLLALAVALLVQALQARPLGLWLPVGLPLAILIALGWTGYWMQQTPAALYLRTDAIVLRSVWDVLTGGWPPPQRLLGVRRDHDRTHLFCTEALYTLRDADWPEAPQLVQALRKLLVHTDTAQTSGSNAPPGSSSTAT